MSLPHSIRAAMKAWVPSCTQRTHAGRTQRCASSGVAPITDGLMSIRAPHRGALMGRFVELLNRTVQTGDGKNAFRVGPDANEQLSVFIDFSMSDGDRVELTKPSSLLVSFRRCRATSLRYAVHRARALTAG
jgi:hypothetical protein